MRNICSMSVLMGGVFCCTMLHAQEFIVPSAIDSSSGAVYSETGPLSGSKEGPEYEGDHYADHMINGSGFPGSYNETTTVLNPRYENAWIAHQYTTKGTLLLDMGGEVSLGAFVLWNGAETYPSDYTAARRGARAFKLRFFNESGGQIGDEFSSNGTKTTVPTVEVAPEIFTFPSAYGAVRFVEWEILSTHGDTDFLSVQEIGFIRGSTDDLQLSPWRSFKVSGLEGGLLLPTNQVYTLSNLGLADLSWSASESASWITVSPENGVLASGSNTKVTLSIDPMVSSFPVGTNTETVVFRNSDSGFEEMLDVQLSIRRRPPPRQEFKVIGLHDTGSKVIDHYSLTGDDRGGIAMGSSVVLYTGDNSTALYQNNDLTGGVRLGVVYNSLVSDLRSGQIYSLAEGATPVKSGTMTSLLLHDPIIGMSTDRTVTLSESIALGNDTGIFAGYGYMLLHTGQRAYSISYDTGEVEDLGTVAAFTHRSSESWAYWGIAEWHGGTNYFVYVKDSQTIARTAAVPDGETSTVSTFSNLGDMGTITAAPELGRWYFQHENGSQFGGGSETLGYADATFYVGSPDGLLINPFRALQFSGYEGGPFSKMGEGLSLKNETDANIIWSVESTSSLFSVSPTKGTLLPDRSSTLDISLTNAVTSYAPGVYLDVLVVSNAVSGIAQSKEVELTVHERLLDHFTFDAIAPTQLIGQAFQTVIHAKDQEGKAFPGLSGTGFLHGESLYGEAGLTIFSNQVHRTSSSSSATRGLRFQVDESMLITHVRAYWGNKVTVWTDSGTLLSSTEFEANPGSWSEIELNDPVFLQGGQTYRIAASTEGGIYGTYYRLYNNYPHSFANGTLLSNCYGSDDSFPASINTSYMEMVDFVYSLAKYAEVQPSPTTPFVGGVWTGMVAMMESSTNMVLKASDGAGHAGKSDLFPVGYVGALSVTMPDSLIEGHGTNAVGTVEIDVPSPVPLVVHLVSDDLSELKVPDSIILPAGTTRMDFPLYVQDDTVMDLTHRARVTASAILYLHGHAEIDIRDNETTTISLLVPSSTFEGVGSVQAAITLDTPPDIDVEVLILSDNATEIIGTTITIEAGQVIKTFTLPIINDYIIDGLQTVTLTARVEGWTDGVAHMFVIDDERMVLSVVLPTSSSEHAGTLVNAGRVRVSGTTPTDLHVSLSSSDTGEITVPDFVTIPGGKSEVRFDITLMDDTEIDGVQTATILAQSPGFIPGSDAMDVHDSDVYAYEIFRPSGNYAVLAPVHIRVDATTIDGRDAADLHASLSLSSFGDEGPVPLTFDNEVNNGNGTWYADVTFRGIGDGVTLIVEDSDGHSATSTVFSVVGSRIVLSPDNWTNSLVVAGDSLHRSMVISNTGNAELEFEIHGVGGGGIDLPEPDLIAYYPFSGNAGNVAGDDNDGTVVGATLTTDRFGNANRAYSFDGVNDYIDLGTMGGFETVSMWIRPRTRSSSDHYFGHAGGPEIYALNNYGGRLTFGNYRASAVSSVDMDNYRNKWVHLLAIVVGPDAKVYLDGKPVADSAVGLGSSVPAQKVNLGRSAIYWNNYFNGDIDDVRIYNRILTDTEIIELSGTADNGRVADYQFNGDANDSSGNGNSGTVVGATLVPDRAGNPAAAYEFDGTSAYVDAGNSLGTANTPFTVSAWMCSTNAQYQILAAKKIAGAWRAGQWQLGVTETQASFSFSTQYGSVHSATVDVLVHDGVWHHVCGVLDSTGSKLFIDGVMVASNTDIDPVGQHDSTIFIGARNDSASPKFFDGKLDDVRIYNRAISDAEVAVLYAQVPVVDNNPDIVAYFPFNGNARDASGHGHDGNVYGATLTVDRFGNNNGAYAFDGAGAYIAIPDDPAFTVSDVSVAAWVKTTDKSDHKYITSCYGPEVESEWYNLLVGSGTGLPAWQVDPGGSFTPPKVEGAVDVADGNWHFVVGVRDTSTANLSIYVDGVLQNTAPDISTDSLNPAHDFWIGGQKGWPSRFFNGTIDDVRIFSRVVTIEEIADLYQESDPSATWLKVNPDTGTVPPGGAMDVTGLFSSFNLVAGDYTNANVTLLCNDALSPSTLVPASMWVLPPAPVMVGEPATTTGAVNTVVWSPVEGSVEYLAEMLADTNSVALQQSNWISTTNHTFNGLALETVHYYHVRASVMTSIGRLDGPWSDWVLSRQLGGALDFDDDLIPDAWEILYFGNTAACNPLADSDGDGLINRDEFIAGMDPTNSDSCFRVRTFDSPTNGMFVVSWDSVTGRVYRVDWNGNLPDGFQPLETGIRHPQNSYTDSVHNAESQGFYRIGVELE